jgi:two-component system, OmpR family, sensor kinase
MLTSLRSRLGLSYALVVVLSLGIVSIGVAWSLITSPWLYRQSAQQLKSASDVVFAQVPSYVSGGKAELKKFLNQQSESLQTRFVVYKADGTVVVDTDTASILRLPRLRTILLSAPDRVYTVIATDRKAWLCMIQPIGDKYYFLAAVQRPQLVLRVLLRDEVVAPILRAGVIATLIALALSLLMANWISRPLARMVATARVMKTGEQRKMPEEGPREIKQLGEAFNGLLAQVNATNQAQRDFMMNVSHELKTPITSIQGFSQAILDGTAQNPEDTRQAAEIIYDEAGRMNRLVASLLQLAKLESGTADLQSQPVDLSLLLNSVADHLSVQAHNSNVAIVRQISTLPIIQGDGDRLAQVFTNLVENAIKYTPAGGSVTISSILKDQTIEVKVKDTGIGISQSDLAHVFDRFFQVDRSRVGPGSSTTSVTKGVGLGLSIARQVVLVHHGSITVESKPGEGSTFITSFPIAPPDPHAKRKSSN